VNDSAAADAAAHTRIIARLRDHALEVRRVAIDVLGWQLSWVVPYFVASVLWGFALKKPLKVRM